MEIVILCYILVALAVFIKAYNNGWKVVSALVLSTLWPLAIPATFAFTMTVIWFVTRGRS